MAWLLVGWRQAQIRIVTESMTFLDKMPSKEEKVKLINTLRTVTDGKVGVCRLCTCVLVLSARVRGR